ncbi:uncharacterized protein Dsimw501_GD28147 [Drosophila simulans]|uniref:Uncharacterized protein n=1 Tax=Drosophila simulans TaxID=7240 RepID=A0A0J9QYG6_DROSI|nr:uncharacterized protein Dsimw501_GD28147 [Drosophila simulans]
MIYEAGTGTGKWYRLPGDPGDKLTSRPPAPENGKTHPALAGRSMLVPVSTDNEPLKSTPRKSSSGCSDPHPGTHPRFWAIKG